MTTEDKTAIAFRPECRSSWETYSAVLHRDCGSIYIRADDREVRYSIGTSGMTAGVSVTTVEARLIAAELLAAADACEAPRVVKVPA